MGQNAMTSAEYFVAWRTIVPVVLFGMNALIFLGFLWYHIDDSASTLFRIHPLAMASAGIGCMVTGCSCMQKQMAQPDPSNPNETIKVPRRLWMAQLHAILNITASIFGTIGFYAIWANKDLFGKLHLQSWHSWFGCVAFLGLMYNVLEGMFQATRHFYGCESKPKKGKAKRSRPARGDGIRWLFSDWLHIWMGYGTLIVWSATTILGLCSNWAIDHISTSLRVLMMMQSAVATGVILYDYITKKLRAGPKKKKHLE